MSFVERYQILIAAIVVAATIAFTSTNTSPQKYDFVDFDTQNTYRRFDKIAGRIESCITAPGEDVQLCAPE